MAFNENTRVKIPAILHLTRLGYEYVSLKDAVRDEDTNIFTEIFFKSISKNVCTELTCKNGEDEFRPDITILINGIPLVFIEVKKPNNRDGILVKRWENKA